MVIHDRGYSRWDGNRDAHVPGVWVLCDRGVTTGLALLFRRKLFAIIIILGAYGPFLFALGALYLLFFFTANTAQFGEIAQEMQSSGLMEYVSASPDTLWGYLLEVQIWVMGILCALVGSGLIAEDKRTNALELYLSRPLSVFQYVLGKLCVLAIFLALVSVVPAVLVILVQMLLGVGAADTAQLINLLWRTLAAGAVIIGYGSLLILAASSLSKRARNATILWVGFLVLVDGFMAEMLSDSFRANEVNLVSPMFCLRQVAAWILQNDRELVAGVSLGSAAAVLGGWVLLFLLIIRKRVRPVEVVA